MSTQPDTPHATPHLVAIPDPDRPALPPLPTLPTTTRAHRAATAGALALTGALLAGDLALVKPALDPILGESERLSWTVAATISVAATAVAWTTGVSAAARAGKPRIAPLALPVLLWTAVAAGLLALRYTAAAATNPDNTHEAWLTAALTSAVFAATAWLAAHHARTSADPLAARARATHANANAALRRYDELSTHTPHLTARVTELDLLLNRHHAEAQRLTEHATHAQHAAAALADELKAHARAEIARHLARPEAVPPATATN